MKMFKYYAIDFKCYSHSSLKDAVKPGQKLDHCCVVALKSKTQEEAKKEIENGWVLVESIGIAEDDKILKKESLII